MSQSIIDSKYFADEKLRHNKIKTASHPPGNQKRWEKKSTKALSPATNTKALSNNGSTTPYGNKSQDSE